MSVQMPMHFSTEKTPLIIGYTPDSKIGFMKLQTVENYKIKQLGLYFPTVDTNKNNNNNNNNKKVQNHPEYVATPNMHMRFRYLPHTIDNRIGKIKKLKLRHPTATCHWDDNTFHHCDIIYEYLRKIKANIQRLKIREPVKISSWDIDLTPIPDEYILDKKLEPEPEPEPEPEIETNVKPNIKKSFFNRGMVFNI